MLKSTKSAPTSPGAYIIRNARNEIIYIGKAKNIKKRVASYIPSRPHDAKTVQMINEAENIEYIITDNEVEALILEARLIKEHQPKYNIDLKDSSRYPYVRITLENEFPKLFITREQKQKTSLYLGPFTDVKSARRSVRLAIDIFGLRVCRTLPKKRCLKHDTEKCSAPCIGSITKEEYRIRIEKAISFLRGNTREVLFELKEKMDGASEKQNYEAAKIYRDQIDAVETLSVRQKIESEREYNEDIIGYIRADETYFVQIFNVRKGVLLGRAKHDAKSASTPKEFISEFLEQHYFSAPVPERIILPHEPKDYIVIEKYLKKISGKNVELSVPKAGTRKKLLDMLQKNIMQDAKTKYDPALFELKEKLGLDSLPIVIEFFDVSNIQGKWLVGAMVRFRNAEAEKQNYRRFRIQTVFGQDDFASMKEIVFRRYSRLVRENAEFPDLVVVDGGASQLSAAQSAMDEAGCTIQLAALAKREEEIYLPGRKKPLLLDKKSGALKLMQKMRDEAHRFAISYHRLLRKKSMI